MVTISYYNGQNSHKITKLNEDLTHNKLKFIVTKSISGLNNAKNLNIPSRLALSNGYNWFIGHPNLTQIVLYDLLFFEPKSIKKFGVNLFYGYDLYNLDYNVNYDTVKVNPITSRHKIIMNYLYVENLYKKQKIFVSDELLFILEMGIIDYLKHMESFNEIRKTEN